MSRESRRSKWLARQAEQAARRTSDQPARKQYATREEQHRTYIDCGPQAWDDRDSGPDY